jgi:peroxiredoxin
VFQGRETRHFTASSPIYPITQKYFAALHPGKPQLTLASSGRHSMTSATFLERIEHAFEQARAMDVPLNEKLDYVAGAVRSISPQFGEAVDRLVGRLQKTSAGATAPNPGDRMPSFLLPDERGELVSLDTILTKGPAAIVFHRGHWCPYCRINTDALAESQRQVEAEGKQIIAIMPDRQQFARSLKSEANANFPILTDMDNGYALSLNLVIWVGEEMRRMISEAGWDIAAYQGNDSWMLPIPATFIVGTDGRVRSRFVDPDYRKRMAIEDLLSALNDAA